MEKIGKYDIVGILGKGAMGIVYKAFDPDISREVAIKTIRFDLVENGTEKDDLMGRFMREAQAVGRLNHPNIITIYDVGREGDMTYIVMQFIEGQSLQSRIAAHEKFSVDKTIKLMLQLCDALECAHEQGIVHRDIKPANILMDKSEKPYVADFGVARVETSTLTQTGTAVGTPSYMAPEQVSGTNVDNRADIFSLGVIMYEMLTGKRPFAGDSITTIIYKIMNEEPLSPLEVKRDLPPVFDVIIKKSLAKDPEKRYQSCKDFAEDIHNLGGGAEKTMAFEVGEEVRKGIKKKKGRKLALRLSLVLLAAIILGGGAYYLLVLNPQQQEMNIAESETTQPLIQDPIQESTLPSTQESIPSSTSSSDNAEVSEIDPFADKIESMNKSFDEGKFLEVRSIAEQILDEDSTHSEAQDFLDRAQAQINAAEVTRIVALGIQSYENGDFTQSIQEMEKVLRLDKNNEEAQRYINLSGETISRGEIQKIVEGQIKAEEEKDLLSLLNDIGLPALSDQKKADAMLFFNYYDDIKSSVSNLTINFSDAENATVQFYHLLTAVYKRTEEKKVIFDGQKTWTFVRQGESWKITAYE
jgi:serine/threonine protein kinase